MPSPIGCPESALRSTTQLRAFSARLPDLTRWGPSTHRSLEVRRPVGEPDRGGANPSAAGLPAVAAVTPRDRHGLVAGPLP
jgi:hypothetical protein